MKRRLYNYEGMSLEQHLTMKPNHICQDFIDDSNTLKVYKLTIPKLEKEKYTKIHIPFSYTSPTEVNLRVYQIDNIDITNDLEVNNQYNKHKADSAIYKLTLESAHNNEDELYIKHNIIDLTKLRFEEESNMLVSSFIIENDYNKNNGTVVDGDAYHFHIESLDFTYEHGYKFNYTQNDQHEIYEQIQNDPLIEYMYILSINDGLGTPTIKVYNTSYFELTYVGGLNDNTKVNSFNIGETGNVHINLCSKEVFYDNSLLKENNDYFPYAHNIYYNKNSVFDYYYLNSTYEGFRIIEHKFLDEQVYLKELVAPEGTSIYFYKTNYDEDLWKLMGLPTSDFEFISQEHLLLKENNNEDEIFIYNKKGEEFKFDSYFENLKMIELKSALTSEGVRKTLQMEYSNNHISSIHEVNKTPNITSYSYFDVFTKKRIDFLKEKRYIIITQMGSENDFIDTIIQVEVFDYNTQESPLKVKEEMLYLDYDSNLIKVEDVTNKKYLLLEYENTIIKKVKGYTNNNLVFEYEYQFDKDSTTVFDIKNNKQQTYMFDKEGNVKQIIYDDGSMTVNTHKNIFLTSTTHKEKISKEPILNGDFINDFYGWEKLLDCEGFEEVLPDKAPIGNAYYVEKTIGTEDIRGIRQRIDLKPGVTYKLSGLLKHNVSQRNDIVIRLWGTYKQETKVVTQISSTETKTEYVEVEYNVNLNANLDMTKTTWEYFETDSITLPLDAYDINLTLELGIQNNIGELYVSNLSLLENEITNNNLMKNTLLNETNEEEEPKHYEFEYIVSSDKLEEDSKLTEFLDLDCKVFKFTGCEITKKISQKIQIEGNVNDTFQTSCFVKSNVNDTEISKLEITFKNEEESFSFSKEAGYNIEYYQRLLCEATSPIKFNEIIITYHYKGVSNAYVTGFELVKKSSISYYNYDKFDKLINVDKKEQTGIICYNDSDEIINTFTPSGEYQDIDYDSYHNVTKVENFEKCSNVYIYDDYGRCERCETYKNGDIILTKETEYLDNKIFETDPNGLTTTHNYDNLGRLIKTVYPTNSEFEFNYDIKDRLTKQYVLSNLKTISNEITYYDESNLITIRANNGTTYVFKYNNYDLLDLVTFNGGTLIKYFYDSNQRVTRIEVPSGSYYYNYDNDLLHEIILNNQLIQTFEYNSDTSLKKETHYEESGKTYSKYYTYDLEGNLSKVTTIDNLGNQSSKMVTYNQNKNVINMSYQDESNNQSFVYTNVNATTKNISKKKYIYDLVKNYNFDIIKGDDIGSGLYGLNATSKNITGTFKDNAINKTITTLSKVANKITYNLITYNSRRKTSLVENEEYDYDSVKENMTKQQTYFIWFKPTGTFSKTYLARFIKPQDSNSPKENAIDLYLDNYGYLVFSSKDGETVTTTSKATLNKWNYVSITIYNENNKTNYLLKLNNENITGNITNELDISKVTRLEVGEYIVPYTDGSLNVGTNPIYRNLEIDIALIGFTSDKLNSTNLDNIYKLGKTDYIENKNEIFDTYTYQANDNNLNKYNYVDFNLNLIMSNQQKEYKTNNQIFEYDQTLRKFVLKCDKPQDLVTYKTLNKGHISYIVRFKLDETNTLKRNIIKLLNNGTEYLGLYVDNQKNLRITDQLQNFSLLDKTINDNNYHTLLITNSNILRIYLDNELITTIDSIPLKEYEVTLGNNLYGSIELFGYSNETNINTNILYEPVVYKNIYDELGRLTKKEYQINDTLYTSTYTYTKDEITKQVNNLGQTIKYSSDKEMNIYTKDDGTYIYEYTYDSVNRLTSEKITNKSTNLVKERYYSYDENGNITSKVISYETGAQEQIEYTYDNTYKDKLVKINNTTINYNGLYPTNMLISNVNQPLTWTNGRLTSIGSNTYEYNSDRIRTKKTVNGITTSYKLDGTKILEEETTINNQTETIKYIYDTNDMLINIITREGCYYYERDITGNIIGLIDKNGYYVVKYTYDAWGNVLDKQILVDSIAAQYNPFVYKGYYYDVETQLFYCNSRYYSPELCRWISPDSIEYLDPHSINGLNLYCYCGNNPIMGYDPNGTFDWNNFWKTALGVTAAVGLAALAIGATIVSGGSFGLLAAGFAMGAAASFVGQGIGNVLSGENFFYDFSLSSIIMGGLAGAAFITGVGGFWGAVAIGAVSNAGTSALENKSWANIGASAIVGGVAAGIGFGVGRVVSNHVFKNSGMTFMDYFELGIIDTNAIFAAGHAFAASWYTFLPSLATSASRGVTKALGNKGIGWF